MDWQTKLKNLKVFASGVVAFLLSIPILISALQQLANHQKVDWTNVLIMGALWAAAHGLIQAKADTTHSTPAQVQQAALEANEAAKPQK